MIEFLMLFLSAFGVIFIYLLIVAILLEILF